MSEWVIYRFQLAHLRVFQSYLTCFSQQYLPKWFCKLFVILFVSAIHQYMNHACWPGMWQWKSLCLQGDTSESFKNFLFVKTIDGRRICLFIFAPLLTQMTFLGGKKWWWWPVVVYSKKISSVFVLHFDAASNRLGFFTLLLSDILNVSSNPFPKQLKTRSGCTSAFFPRVTFQMSFQIPPLNRWKVTLHYASIPIAKCQ